MQNKKFNKSLANEFNLSSSLDTFWDSTRGQKRIGEESDKEVNSNTEDQPYNFKKLKVELDSINMAKMEIGITLPKGNVKNQSTSTSQVMSTLTIGSEVKPFLLNYN